MSQQPQPRPWFRSLARTAAPPPPAPAPVPAPVPRPPFIRPIFTQTFAPPPPPAPTPPSPPQASIPTPPSPPSPIPPPATASPPTPATPPPRVTATAPPSPPPMAAAAPPPSPITKSPNSSPKLSPPVPIPTSYTPQSPKPRTSAPSSPLPTRLVSLTPSPPPTSKAAAASPVTTTNDARMLTLPLPSPQIPKYDLKSPSPKTKPLTPPPSPFTLPPPVLHADRKHNSKIPPEAEQKIITVNDNIAEKAKPIPSRDSHYNHYNSPKFATQTKKEEGNHTNHHKKLSDSEDIGMRAITLAGENRGAIMELIPSQYPTNGHFATNQHGKNGNHNKSWSDIEKSASDSEGKWKHKDKSHPAMTPPFRSYTNSNVQGVNNSILYNCSCTHNDPGVHLTISRKTKDPIQKHHV